MGTSMLLLLVVFAVMMIPMLMMSSRQRKAQQQQQEMLSKLAVGDEVRTHSGFYGLIVEEYDDTVILEAEDGSQLKWARAAIAMRVDPTDGTPDLGTDAERESRAHAAEDDLARDRDGSSAAADASYDVERPYETDRPHEAEDDALSADRADGTARGTDRI